MGFWDIFRSSENRTQLSNMKADDPEFFVGTSPNSFRDRTDWNLQETIENCLTCWRENPLARRIVNLQTEFVIGNGISIESDDLETQKVIMDFWNHALNRMDIRSMEWCDELTRTGNLFVLLSSDQNGNTFVRAVPATSIKEIETAENDLEQALKFTFLADENLDYKTIQAENIISPSLEPRILHFTVNRPVGAKWGEPDLAPLLVWLQRYSSWLEDRARLNKYRNSFLYTVKTQLRTETERIARQKQLNMRPLTPGSILVTNETEQWDVINPQLESADAAADGLAIKKQIAAGAGIPLHFLAEPESQNKASAEAAGGATFRTYEQRQKIFLWIIETVLQSVLARYEITHPDFKSAHFQVIGSDISGKDNLDLSTSAATITNVMTQLRKIGLVDRKEFLRMVYQFAGESLENIDKILIDAEKDPLTEQEYEYFFVGAGEDDATKFNTTTIETVKHYDQGAEV